ncbi:hypothetical protein CBS147482_859 [Aspergillus niger]|nr:hypothetical protein CBS147482_859 [Aspergillus niger]
MLSSLLRFLPHLGRRWKPLSFPNFNFVRIPNWHKIEEETLPEYTASQYYPTRIGEIIKERYQVIGKLGYGSTSTAWLARNMENRRYVMLKIFIEASSMGQQVDNELNIVVAFLRRNPVERLPSAVIAVVLHRLFLALDFLHTECKIAHTDIKADNIMFGIKDDSVFTDIEENELQQPVPRKEVDERTIYMSRELKVPKGIGAPVLCDFGSAMVVNDEFQRVFIQPQIYRAPEVILGVPWT